MYTKQNESIGGGDRCRGKYEDSESEVKRVNIERRERIIKKRFITAIVTPT